MIRFPSTWDDAAVNTGAVVRSGGTDLQGRLRSAGARPEIIDLTGIDGFSGITVGDTETRIGAGTAMATAARHLAAVYPALAATTGGLATPQVRAIGTFGGNLVQRTRCWYYRHPGLECFKTGGDGCPSRDGRHLYGVVFDRSACVHPHPSSIAMALLNHDDAVVELADGRQRSVPDLLGDGVDPTRDHTLDATDIVAAIRLGPPWPAEQGAYFRSISRFEAEWPLVECAARASVDNGTVTRFALALGGVATVPLRMTDAEREPVGTQLDDATIIATARACAAGTSPLPETGYKVDLIQATVIATLERLRSSVADA